MASTSSDAATPASQPQTSQAPGGAEVYTCKLLSAPRFVLHGAAATTKLWILNNIPTGRRPSLPIQHLHTTICPAHTVIITSCTQRAVTYAF
jgi:hypothetical protein